MNAIMQKAGRIFLSGKHLSVLLLGLFAATGLKAQCPASINATVSGTTPANCPSSGGFVIGGTSNPSINYQIISGPLGYPTNPQSSGTFNSLLAGAYSVRAYCSADPSIADTVSVTIADNYVQVAANSATSNICTNGTPGGLITTTVTAGNRTPFTYAYWQGNPNADNSTLTFGTTNTYVAPAFGTYNVRVKDACGVYVTQQVTITRTYPEPIFIASAYPRNGSLSCAELQDSIMMVLYSNVDISVLPATGGDIDIYQSSGSCTPGALVKTVHIDPSFNGLIKVPNFQNLVFKLRTPCGDTTTFCYAYNPGYQDFSIHNSLEQRGCPQPGNPVPLALYSGPDNPTLATNPITYHVTNAGNTLDTTIVANNPNYIYIKNLLPDTYTVIATDACGNVDTQSISPGASLTGPVRSANVSAYRGCTSMNGRTTLQANIIGSMANMAGATCTIIAPSPSNVGEAGEWQGGSTYIWRNVIPGATYTIQVDNNSDTCNQKDTVTATVPNDPSTQLNQSVTSTVQQLCGGTGNITITIANNSNGAVIYRLLNSANDTIASGTQPGGTFANLPAGTYRTLASVTGCGLYDHDLPADTAVILAGGSGPSIIKKLGIICEDVNGNPTSTGKALVSFIGVAPMSVDYKLTSAPDVPASYTNVSTNSGGTETIDGLQANTSYTIRVSDGCGNAQPTQVSIGQLAPLHVDNTVNPCVNSSYTLSVPDLVNATYSWKKDNVALPNNTHEINFPSYTAGDNGVYECTIVIASCVTRVVATMLNSQLCNQPLPVTLFSFDVTDQGNQALLSWITAREQNNKGFDIERNTNGTDWARIGFAASQAPGGNSAQPLHYAFYDKAPLSGMNYYRLKQTDADGAVVYSEVRGLHFGNQSAIRIAPNPVSDELQVSGAPLGATVRLLDVTSRVLAEHKVTGPLTVIGMAKLPAAIYLIQVIGNGSVMESIKLLKK